MYYFYWPVPEALQRDRQAEELTFQVHDSQPGEEVIDDFRIRRCPAGVRKEWPFSWPFIFALLSTDAYIVYFHGYGEGRSELAILLSRLRGRKIIFAPYFHVYPYLSLVRESHDSVSAWGRKGAVHNTIWPGRNGGVVVYSVCGCAWYYLSSSIDPERTASIDQEVSSCP